MVKYTHSHKSPVEAKVMLLLGICGARPCEFEYEDWGDNRIVKWKYGKRIPKSARDYVRMVFVGEHNQVLRFAEFRDENVFGEYIYRYIVAPLKN